MRISNDDRIPRDRDDDYAPSIIAERRAFVERRTGTRLEHVGGVPIDPAVARGNVEHFTGVAQVPLGFAGPLCVDGEHARGDFFVPMATTEGTLLASYGRGMRLTRAIGGVRTTVVADAMQRAPVFGFDDARGALAFVGWIDAHKPEISRAAEATTKTGVLVSVERYVAAHFAYLRFNYTTGDAAGQNLTSKATDAACRYIHATYDGTAPIREFTLSGAMDTDKKASFINTLNTRGKRVVAEVTVPEAAMLEHLHVTGKALFAARSRSTLGAWMAGSTNNGAHAANALAAIFIATGQDVANIAESHVAVVYADLLADGALYYSITLPSLIVATYGGGTGLPTQRECLDVLGCYGSGNVRKFAEIVAATVLCGELSLGAAVVAGEWVDAHERLGRNRP